MGLRKQLIGLLDRIQARGAEAAERATKDRQTVDAVLAWSLARAEAAGPVHFPVQYLQFIRDCTAPAHAVWVEVRNDVGQRDDASKNFASFVNALGDLPALDFASAERLARSADLLRANVNPATGEREHGDQQRHFSRTASFGVKGRILYDAVKILSRRQVVELGTFWGMSALFMLEALETAGPDAHLTTVELLESVHRKASALIHARFDGRATCIKGSSQDVVPEFARTMTGVDLLFHDAAHSGEAYVHDFNAAEPCLAPGAVVLFDDIRWFDRSMVANDPKCHDGWMEVTRHPRVRWAGELDGCMGALLLR